MKYGVKDIFDSIYGNQEVLKELVKNISPSLEKKSDYISPFKKNKADFFGDFKPIIKPRIEKLFDNISQKELINIYSDFYTIFMYNPELKTEKNESFIKIIENVLNDKFRKFRIYRKIDDLKNNLTEQYNLSVIKKLLVAYNKKTPIIDNIKYFKFYEKSTKEEIYMSLNEYIKLDETDMLNLELIDCGLNILENIFSTDDTTTYYSSAVNINIDQFKKNIWFGHHHK